MYRGRDVRHFTTIDVTYERTKRRKKKERNTPPHYGNSRENECARRVVAIQKKKGKGKKKKKRKRRKKKKKRERGERKDKGEGGSIVTTRGSIEDSGR